MASNEDRNYDFAYFVRRLRLFGILPIYTGDIGKREYESLIEELSESLGVPEDELFQYIQNLNNSPVSESAIQEITTAYNTGNTVYSHNK